MKLKYAMCDCLFVRTMPILQQFVMQQTGEDKQEMCKQFQRPILLYYLDLDQVFNKNNIA